MKKSKKYREREGQKTRKEDRKKVRISLNIASS